MGEENGFVTDTTTNAAVYFTDDSLQNYAAVIFLNTTGDVLDQYGQVAFERYIQAGGGFVGIHAAADTEYDWGWYGRLVGGYFYDHPGINDTFPNVQPGVLTVTAPEFAATSHLPASWNKTDEFYSFEKLNKEVSVVLAIKEDSYLGGFKMGDHPMAWYHEYDGGRAFYTALGHTEASYTDPQFLKHLAGGINYAIGDNELDYDDAKSQPIPEEDRFVKTQLTQGTFFEPTEMTILPNFDILVTQRRGEIMLYSNKDKQVSQAGFLHVYYKAEVANVNAEEGVLGIAADPDFSKNNFVYIFYSPADTSVNRLSRFVFKNNRLDMNSEKVVLQFFSQRNICCHTGGSVAFGPDNLLYLSTGDNSTPFNEPNASYVNHGFAPLNDQPGHEQYDARRSSGNTNDLRGKILRIRIKPDGTYEIPNGNLFAPGTSKTRPEIFVMGNRNPYRISVDKKNGTLYWGEVGPDANADSFATRGPRGYDEINRAASAGYFGWPLFVGKNYAYRRYNYATGQSGEAFDAQHPKNESRYNSGLTDLPPAQPAFIWYPYGASKEFPQVGTGGRNAMAGPVYYTDMYPEKTRYPDYFNGKLIIYEWMRDWMKVVSMMPDGSFDKMDPFMENTKISACIDMEVGPDGRLYLLEYGKGWFTQNPDAGLSRIDYISGNRPPKITDLQINQESGSLPYRFTAKLTASDPEKDALTYTWHVGNKTIETQKPVLEHTISEPGEYAVYVSVMDGEKAEAKSREITVYAGNAQPQVFINIQSNKTFYFANKPVAYEVMVKDPGDSVKKNNLFITTDFLQGNEDLASEGHQFVPEEILGKNLTLSLDCKSCHKEQGASIGPAYMQVAKKYKNDDKAGTYLINKIIKGGAGVWGEVAMPAHPTLKEGDVKQIVTYIMSLGNAKKQQSLPAKGSIKISPPLEERPRTVFTLVATYTDEGGAGVRPLTGSQRILLRNSRLDARQLSPGETFSRKDSAGHRFWLYPSAEGVITIKKVDLTNIAALEFETYANQGTGTYSISVTAGSGTGTALGNGVINLKPGKNPMFTTVPLSVQATNALADLYIVVRGNKGIQPGAALKSIRFVPK